MVLNKERIQAFILAALATVVGGVLTERFSEKHNRTNQALERIAGAAEEMAQQGKMLGIH